MNARIGPTISNFFEYPWRCPASVTVTIPTEGFSPVQVGITNGNCAVEGSFLEITTTYTEPTCTGAIDQTNPNPACDFNLYFAVQAATGATPATPGGNILMTGANRFTYNVANTFNYPQILGNPLYLSVPDGIYNIFIWIAPTSGSQTFATAMSRDPRKAIVTQVTALFDSADGLNIIVNSITYPNCPATTLATPAPANSIAINITIIDQNWNGPYNLTFQTVSGRFIHNQTINIHDPEACGLVCSTLLTNTTSCSVCDIQIRANGIKVTLYVGTGISSPNEQGLYLIRVNAIGTQCFASEQPFITPLNTFTTAIACIPDTCSNRQNGRVTSVTDGGTFLPIPLGALVQNSDLTLAEPRYNFFWNYTIVLSNDTNITTHFTGVDKIVAAQNGFYQLTAVDFKGCTASDSCEERPLTAPIELELIGSHEPNCTNEQGAITVGIVNNTGTPPFTLYEVSPNPSPVATSMGYTLTYTSVTPGVETLFMVCDANSCCSPMLNLSIHAAQGFTVRLSVDEMPCSTSVASGQISAHIYDINNHEYTGNGPSFVWCLNSNRPPACITTAGATLTNAGVGVWTVTAKNLNGCTSTASIALFSAVSLGFTQSRTPPEVDPGVIQGAIVGGNGPPYTLTVQPFSEPPSPPDIGNLVIISIIQADAAVNNFITTYKISMVPPQATLFITITDKDGCVYRNISVGGKIPITQPLITPSQSPQPHNFRNAKETKDYTILISLVAGTVLLIAVSCVCIYGCLDYDRREREREKERTQ